MSTGIEATKKPGPKTKFTEDQLSILKKFYAQNPYPRLKERERLSNLINCPEKQIKNWFQNTRSATKKTSHGLVNSMNSSAVSASSLLENSNIWRENSNVLYGEEQQADEELRNIHDNRNTNKSTTGKCSYLFSKLCSNMERHNLLAPNNNSRTKI